jgi:hypothetical protein
MDVTWQPGEHGLKEDRLTSALLRITFAEGTATAISDSWSATVLDSIRVSAYPLALWFASCWWRLRWEPRTAASSSADWLMSHDMRAAGHGFIWPPLRFESDGEHVEALCRPSSPKSREPVRYLSSFRATVIAEDFERSVDAFMRRVLARLTELGMQDTDLHRIWQEVLVEPRNPESAELRRLEAQLGFDPDEAPGQVFTSLCELAAEAGRDAIAEIAPALRKNNLPESLKQTVEFARSPGIQGRLAIDRKHFDHHKSEYKAVMPWERGYLLARDARSAWGLIVDAISDETLSDVLEVMPRVLESSQGHAAPMGLAVRQEDNERLSLHFRKSHRTARRFEAARFIAEGLLSINDSWLPATDTSTARQKVQRGFAAEFLCPIESLKDYLQEDYSNDELIDDAADYYSVGPLMIKSHLVNHGLLPVESLYGSAA